MLKVLTDGKMKMCMYSDEVSRWIIYASNLFKCLAILGNWLNASVIVNEPQEDI